MKHSYEKTYYYDSCSGKEKCKKEGSSSPKQQGSKFPSGKHVPNPSNKVILHYIAQTKKTKVLRDNEIVTSEFSFINSSNISSSNGSRCGTKCLDDGLMRFKRKKNISN